MRADPLLRRSLELLARGHDLYAGPATAPAVVGVAEGPSTSIPSGLGPAGEAWSRRLTESLRRTATADAALVRLVRAAHADHAVGHDRTRAVLADARSDRMPAADTPVGRREAMRRAAGRLRTQHGCIAGSRRHARLLARRMNRLPYPRPPERRGHRSPEHALPLNGLRYNRSFAPGRIRQRIAVALDHLGITDRKARRNWLRGYETLIARESGGQPSAIASEPAAAVGPSQADGDRLGYARGLTQTIPATFARYHQAGTATNIYDPIANICASMNYVMHRYGVNADGSNLAALVQQADPGRPPRGY